MLQALIGTCFGVRDDACEQSTPSQALLLAGVLGESRVQHPPWLPCQEVTLQTHNPLTWAALAAREEGQASARPRVLPKLDQT